MKYRTPYIFNGLISLSFFCLLVSYARATLYDHSRASEIAFDDDVLTPLDLTVPIKFRGMDINKIYISDNGLVTTDKSKQTFTDAIQINTMWIAPYGSDITLAGSPKIKHASNNASGTAPPSGVNAHVSHVFPHSNFSATAAYVITWENVQVFGATESKGNTFQLALVTDGTASYAIFLYDVISWYPGVAGVSAGDGNVQRVCSTDTSAAQQLPQKTNSDVCGVDPGFVVLRLDQTGSWGPDCVAVNPPQSCVTQATTQRLSACARRRRKRRESQ